jgi:hypothetical protein
MNERIAFRAQSAKQNEVWQYSDFKFFGARHLRRFNTRNKNGMDIFSIPSLRTLKRAEARAP